MPKNNKMRVTSQAPMTKQIHRGSGLTIHSKGQIVTVSHTESVFYGQLEAGYYKSSYVNPGRPELNPDYYNFYFPWLNSVAQAFEYYRFRDLKFTFAPSAATTATGYYVLALDQDPIDRAGSVSEVQLMSFKDSVSGPIWQENTLKISKSDLLSHGWKYVKRTNAVVPNQDLRNTDLGKFYLWNSPTSTSAAFRIHATYTIELMVPTVSLSKKIPSVHIERGSSATPATPYGGQDGVTPPSVAGDKSNFEPMPDGKGVKMKVGGVFNVATSVNGAQVDAVTVPDLRRIRDGVQTVAATVNLLNRLNNATNTETSILQQLAVQAGDIINMDLTGVVSSITDMHQTWSPSISYPGTHFSEAQGSEEDEKDDRVGIQSSLRKDISWEEDLYDADADREEFSEWVQIQRKLAKQRRCVAAARGGVHKASDAETLL